MDFADLLVLGHMQANPDREGYPQKSEFVPEISVYGEKQGVTREEHYKAAAIGKTISAVFVVWADEYTGQSTVQQGKTLYHVERAYPKGAYCHLSCTLDGQK